MGRREDESRLRRRIAHESARIIAEQGIEDFRQAKRKAAARLGVVQRGALPGNAEIEAALIEHQRLFGAERHDALIGALRRTAREAMELLAEFEPRLVGPVLAGTAAAHSAIDLHVFADAPEAVCSALERHGLRYRACERRLKSRRTVVHAYPGFRFELARAQLEATVFPVNGLRQAPISPIDGRPMRRADLHAVGRLLEDALSA